MTTIKNTRTGIAAEIKKLENLLLVGNFSRVLIQSKGLEEGFKIHEKIKSLSGLDELKIKASAVMSEIYFYQGNLEKAEDILKPLLDQENTVLNMGGDILARDKLQIAEYYYVNNNAQRALEIAESVLRQAEGKNNLFDMGECAHYIQRMHYHLEHFADANHYCNLALEYFSTIGLENPPEYYNVDWRLGRALCRAGFVCLRSSDLKQAKTMFMLSKLRLDQSHDTLRKAHVERGLGCIYRSLGDYEKSRINLEAAMKKYETIGHKGNIARTLISMGQTLFNGNKVDEAATVLNKALEISEKYPKEKTESHLWLSWIFQRPDAKNVKQAVYHLNEAIKLKCKSPELIAEVYISLGYCKIASKLPMEAKNHFEFALQAVEQAHIPKVMASALLSLAEYHGNANNINVAQRYLQRAEEILSKDSDRRFLNNKVDKIKKLIEGNSTGYFIFKTNDICEWKKMLRKFENWVILTIESTKDKEKKAAIVEKLKITGQGLYLMKKRSAPKNEKDTPS